MGVSRRAGSLTRWAMALLGESERVAVWRVRDGVPPHGWAERVEFEMVRASAEVIVPRTVAIDEAVRARLAPQLVIMGAGLDDRAWRMPELDGADVFEIDHPASQRDKRSRVRPKSQSAAVPTGLRCARPRPG